MLKEVWLKAKTLSVLKGDYAYEPAVPGFQNDVFSGVISFVIENKGNEYDAAAIFMLSQIGLMDEPKNLDHSAKTFVRRIRDVIITNKPQSNLFSEISEIVHELNDL